MDSGQGNLDVYMAAVRPMDDGPGTSGLPLCHRNGFRNSKRDIPGSNLNWPGHLRNNAIHIKRLTEFAGE